MGETLRKIAKTACVRVEYLNETLGLESSASTMRRAPIAPCPDLQELALDPKQIELRSIANYRAAKRALDFALSALLLILLAPVWLGLAVLIKLTLGSPVYFWQLRPGRYGRDFKLVKFRTLSSAYDVNGRPVGLTGLGVSVASSGRRAWTNCRKFGTSLSERCRSSDHARCCRWIRQPAQADVTWCARG
jgi:hypothetical protein